MLKGASSREGGLPLLYVLNKALILKARQQLVKQLGQWQQIELGLAVEHILLQQLLYLLETPGWRPAVYFALAAHAIGIGYVQAIRGWIPYLKTLVVRL